MEQLSSAEARRIALAAQGFGVQRSDKVTVAQWRRTIDRLCLHQIDSVNILVRAPINVKLPIDVEVGVRYSSDRPVTVVFRAIRRSVMARQPD